MLQNNELMRKINSTEEASGQNVKGQRGDHRVGDPKAIQRLLEVLLAIFTRNMDTLRKII